MGVITEPQLSRDPDHRAYHFSHLVFAPGTAVHGTVDVKEGGGYISVEPHYMWVSHKRPPLLASRPASQSSHV